MDRQTDGQKDQCTDKEQIDSYVMLCIAGPTTMSIIQAYIICTEIDWLAHHYDFLRKQNHR